MTLAEERRSKRSTDPLVALHYQLARTRSEGQFDAVVVADGAGLVVAGAGTWALCEELAAYAPLLAREGPRPDGPRAQDARGRPLEQSRLPVGSRVAEISAQVEVQPVILGEQTVLLCARGCGSSGSAMRRAAEGVARILAT